MKISKMMAFLLLGLCMTEWMMAQPAWAVSHKKATLAQKKQLRKVNPRAQLGTSFRFDGTTLRGKYQSALGTTATVENDKYLDNLLGGRKSFRDRVHEDEKRN